MIKGSKIDSKKVVDKVDMDMLVNIKIEKLET